MRARFAAAVLGDLDFTLATHEGLSEAEQAEIRATHAQIRWTKLEVRAVEAGGPDDAEGFVEFVALGRRGPRPQRLHERSRFVRRDGRWLYVDGELFTIGRAPKARLRRR
ncbi:MAG: hypothetical protein KC620_13525 [Myxococcales bacterium]|nr:hypothetical protein [Myxococcales bacterium]